MRAVEKDPGARTSVIHQIATDDLVYRIAAHPEDYDVAANTDPMRDIESETPDE